MSPSKATSRLRLYHENSAMKQQLRLQSSTLAIVSFPFINSSSLHPSDFSFLNLSHQKTSSESPERDTHMFAPVKGPAKYICYVLYGLVLFIGVFGNIFVFYVFGYRKKTRNSGDVYILSLACADFLASLIVPSILLSDLVTNYSGWLYGSTMCHILPPIAQATMSASGWSLVLISLDRYR